MVFNFVKNIFKSHYLIIQDRLEIEFAMSVNGKFE